MDITHKAHRYISQPRAISKRLHQTLKLWEGNIRTSGVQTVFSSILLGRGRGIERKGNTLGEWLAIKVVSMWDIWFLGSRAKLPTWWTASKRWLASNKDWEEGVWPQHEELHQEGFKLNWKWEGQTSIEVKMDEALHIIRGMTQTVLVGVSN